MQETVGRDRAGIGVACMWGDHCDHLGVTFWCWGGPSGTERVRVTLVDRGRKLNRVRRIELAGDGRLPNEQRPRYSRGSDIRSSSISDFCSSSIFVSKSSMVYFIGWSAARSPA